MSEDVLCTAVTAPVFAPMAPSWAPLTDIERLHSVHEDLGEAAEQFTVPQGWASRQNNLRAVACCV